jgi:hypothetical protein
LTEHQLNAILDHLNYQDKITRTSLVGVGIVCGLHIRMEGAGIKLSSGIAITTDGDLIKMEDTIFSNFKLFKDANVKYPLFLSDDEGKKPISLWELTENTEGSDVEPLGKFKSKTKFGLEEAAAILYLESYAMEPEDCSPVDCDTQGEMVVSRLRVLLVSPDDIGNFLKGDNILKIFMDGQFNSHIDNFTRFYVPRVIHRPERNSLIDFIRDYEGVYKEKMEGVKRYIQTLGSLDLLNEDFKAYESDISGLPNNITTQSHSAQYKYDFFKDLVDTCNEVTELIQQNHHLCNPDANSFPKHILLGKIDDSSEEWRHSFYPSPALNYPTEAGQVQKLYKRLLQMVKAFFTEVQKEVKITPSRPWDQDLGERAIPFYYDLKASEVYKNWRLQKNHFPIPNYYSNEYPSGFKPLDIHLKGHDFYRIEGHTGRPIKDVHKELEKIKTEKGLGFKITKVAIGRQAEVEESNFNFEEHRVYFDDLQAILQAWNDEQKCMVEQVADFFSGFSLEEKGGHQKRTSPIFKGSKFGHLTPKNKLYHDQITSNVVINYLKTGRQKESTAEKDPAPAPKSNLGDFLERNVKTTSSRNDIVAETKRRLNDQIQNWPRQHVEILIDIPLDMFGSLKETEDYKLTRIEDFTPENLEKFIVSLKKQCDESRQAIDRIQKLLKKENEELANRPWVGAYVQMLQKVQSSCCLAEKMTALYQSIIDRKKRLLDQFKFNIFIEKHPGAEHLAGVPKGGTFVLLYKSGEDFENIADGTVVGDLYLPYVCCSDTPSTSFVFSEKAAELRLPVDHVCIKKGDEVNEILMDVTPLSGKVRAFSGEKEMEGVVTQRETRTFFSPGNVPETEYGKPIRFTVNEQIVDPKIYVHKKPIPKFSVGKEIDYQKENTIAIVPFENQTENREDYEFEWEFGTGETLTNNERNITQMFNVQPGEKMEFELRLKAKNGSCKAVFTDSIILEVPAISVDKPELDIPVEYVCMKEREEAEMIPLRVKPESAKVIAFLGGKQLKNAIVEKRNKSLFNPNVIPKNGYEKPIRFSVNDQHMEPTIRLFKKPIPKFSIGENIEYFKDNTIALVNFENLTDSLKYLFEWDFGNGKTSSSKNKNISQEFPVEPGIALEQNISLKAKNGQCHAVFTDTLKLNVPAPTEPSKDCKQFAQEGISDSVREIVSVMPTARRQFNTFFRILTADLDNVLAGKRDKEIFEFIQNYQINFQRQIERQKVPQQLTGMRVYYELTLIYFYVHSCREKKIGQLNPEKIDWRTSTEVFRNNYTKVFLELLKSRSLLQKFETVNNYFKERFTVKFQTSMKVILAGFKKYSG